jgi:transposase
LAEEHGLPVKFGITPGYTYDIQAATELLANIQPGQMVLGDKADDANWLRVYVSERRGSANILLKSLRKSPICFSPWLYKQRNLAERFFNKLKYFRRTTTSYDKLGSAFFAMVQLACIRITLRHYESAA